MTTERLRTNRPDRQADSHSANNHPLCDITRCVKSMLSKEAALDASLSTSFRHQLMTLELHRISDASWSIPSPRCSPPILKPLHPKILHAPKSPHPFPESLLVKLMLQSETGSISWCPVLKPTKHLIRWESYVIHVLLTAKHALTSRIQTLTCFRMQAVVQTSFGSKASLSLLLDQSPHIIKMLALAAGCPRHHPQCRSRWVTRGIIRRDILHPLTNPQVRRNCASS